MLHEFVTANRDAIVVRAREKLTARPWPPSSDDLENGVPLFLAQLSDTLESQARGAAYSPDAIGAAATRHGADLLALGFTVSQVVHDYGDICQAVTEMAIEQQAPITIEEFNMLNRTLDTAIAEAVTEHARLTAASRATEELERSGQLAHDTRDMLNSAMLAFHSLKRGTVAINGSTGAVLGRSLGGLRDLVDKTLSETRMASNRVRPERTAVAPLINEVAAAAGLNAEYHGLHFAVEPMPADLFIDVDPQLFSSALMNLLNNAIKFTRPAGRVVLRAHRKEELLLVEVEDQCGGFPHSTADAFAPYGERRGKNRTGLGLGLSIARKAIRLHGGDIRIADTPGKGCVFVVEVPLASDTVLAAPSHTPARVGYHSG